MLQNNRSVINNYMNIWILYARNKHFKQYYMEAVTWNPASGLQNRYERIVEITVLNCQFSSFFATNKRQNQSTFDKRNVFPVCAIVRRLCTQAWGVHDKSEVCGGACHVVERILKCSKNVAHINFVLCSYYLREPCVSTAQTYHQHCGAVLAKACQCVAMEIYHMSVHGQWAMKALESMRRGGAGLGSPALFSSTASCKVQFFHVPPSDAPPSALRTYTERWQLPWAQCCESP